MTSVTDIHSLCIYPPVSLSTCLSLEGSRPNILQEAEVPLVGQDQCQIWLPEYTITSSMLCAGYPEGGIDTCQVTTHLDSTVPSPSDGDTEQLFR